MTDEPNRRAQDAEEHRKTYARIMKATGEIGVPFALALAVFFTNLVLANGLMTALFASVLTYFIVFFIVKAFFSH
ncbi:MAG: hypothetical protein ACE5FO_12295 [Parvularculaceae bacterium]